MRKPINVSKSERPYVGAIGRILVTSWLRDTLRLCGPFLQTHLYRRDS